MGFFGSGSCIGIDIGTRAVKVADASLVRGRLEVKNICVEPLPELAVVEGQLMNAGAVTDAIRTATKGLKASGRRAAVAFSGSFIVKFFVVPKMSPEEFAASAEWEWANQIPGDPADYSRTGSIVDRSRPDAMDVVLLGVRKEVERDFLACVADAELRPVLADFGPFALQNLFEVAYGTPNETAALIDAGGGFVKVTLTRNGQPVAFRQIQLHARQAMQPEVSNIVYEICRTLDYFAASHIEPARMYLTGGASRITEFRSRLADISGFPVEIFDPLRNATFAAKADQGQIRTHAAVSGVALGLTLRKQNDEK